MSDIASKKVLFIADHFQRRTLSLHNAISAVAHELHKRNIRTQAVEGVENANPIITNDMDIDAILLATDMTLEEEPPRSEGVQYTTSNFCFCFTDYTKALDCVNCNKLWKILKEMGIPDHLICLLRNLYAGQEATEIDMGQQTGYKSGK